MKTYLTWLGCTRLCMPQASHLSSPSHKILCNEHSNARMFPFFPSAHSSTFRQKRHVFTLNLLLGRYFSSPRRPVAKFAKPLIKSSCCCHMKIEKTNSLSICLPRVLADRTVNVLTLFNYITQCTLW